MGSLNAGCYSFWSFPAKKECLSISVIELSVSVMLSDEPLLAGA